MIKSIDTKGKTRIVIKCGNTIIMDVISYRGIEGGIDTDKLKNIISYYHNYSNTSVLEIEV